MSFSGAKKKKDSKSPTPVFTAPNCLEVGRATKGEDSYPSEVRQPDNLKTAHVNSRVSWITQYHQVYLPPPPKKRTFGKFENIPLKSSNKFWRIAGTCTCSQREHGGGGDTIRIQRLSKLLGSPVLSGCETKPTGTVGAGYPPPKKKNL